MSCCRKTAIRGRTATTTLITKTAFAWMDIWRALGSSYTLKEKFILASPSPLYKLNQAWNHGLAFLGQGFFGNQLGENLLWWQVFAWPPSLPTTPRT